MWTVTILSAEIVRGMLRINFEFTNNGNTFTEYYDTRAGQPLSWLNRLIYQRIQDLNTLQDLIPVIPIGPYEPTPPNVPEPDEAMETYRDKLALYYRMERMIAVGVIDSDNAIYVATKQWLRDNFINDYNTLFVNVNGI